MNLGNFQKSVQLDIDEADNGAYTSGEREGDMRFLKITYIWWDRFGTRRRAAYASTATTPDEALVQLADFVEQRSNIKRHRVTRVVTQEQEL